jgi:hypothetical protein
MIRKIMLKTLFQANAEENTGKDRKERERILGS